MYGGRWGHWLLWSSILATSLNDGGKTGLTEKMEFSTLAMVTNGILTEGMKRGFGRKRPNGSCCKSFPSGHTSHSFTIATIVNELYGNEMGIAAYCLAVLVAASRINDNKHYLSDVLFGAGLGTAVGRGFALAYQNRLSDNGIVPFPQLSLKIYIPLN
jgi:membrane-associated phospholipid phosphatase